jgi:lipoyl(octanoyl) transferase
MKPFFPDFRTEVRRHSFASSWNYSMLDARQRELAVRVRSGEGPTFLLSEVAPVITYGRRTPASDIGPAFSPVVDGAPVERLTGTLEAYATDRGGFATYHGPGQWVLFPVGSLEDLVGDSRGIQKMIQSLLNVALEVGLFYDSSAHIRTGCELGVWTHQGKFAAAGIHLAQGVVLHGLSVNGFQTAESFQGLRPCGLDAPVDYLLKVGFKSENGDEIAASLTRQEAEFELLGQRILGASRRVFGF